MSNRANAVYLLCFLLGSFSFGIYAVTDWNDRIEMVRECVVEQWENAAHKPGAIMVGVKDYCKAKVAIERGW